MSVRSDVFNNVCDSIRGIKGPDNFISTVDQVLKGDVQSGDFTGSSIFAGVYVSGYTVGPSLTKFDRKRDLQKVLLVNIHAVIKTKASTVEDDIAALQEDFEKAIFADPHRGRPDAVVDTAAMQFSAETVQIDGAGALAEFVATVRVTWLGDPATP